MGAETGPDFRIAALAPGQWGVVVRLQLRCLGLSDKAIRHRVATGRLHPRWPRVYAVGRRELSREGEWMGAVLTCGPGALLSHFSAAMLWGFWGILPTQIEVSLPRRRHLRRRGMLVHRPRRATEASRHRGIPVTTPVRTLIDLAAVLERERLEASVNEAIRVGRTSERQLHASLRAHSGLSGVTAMRELPDGFGLTRSRLERLFLPIAKRAGLPRPLTQKWVNGFEVDFHWPELGLVVETDGGAFHRTAAQQTKDRIRHQTHLAAGFTPVRFTHLQIAPEPGYVEDSLRKILRRLRP